MITEDYVSFETAKLLREKGFDEACLSHYEVSDKQQYISDSEVKNSDFELEKGKCISAPTLQMAIKWLRKEREALPSYLSLVVYLIMRGFFGMLRWLLQKPMKHILKGGFMKNLRELVKLHSNTLLKV